LKQDRDQGQAEFLGGFRERKLTASLKLSALGLTLRRKAADSSEVNCGRNCVSADNAAEASATEIADGGGEFRKGESCGVYLQSVNPGRRLALDVFQPADGVAHR
jgi:hypothetical protein